MARRYVVREESGCGSGCGTVIGLIFLIGMFMNILPFLAIFIGLVVLIWLLWYMFSGRQQSKERQFMQSIEEAKRNEEREIAELERQNELDRRRIAALKEREELDKHYHKNNKDDWEDF
ncbi:hypothetical protein [Floricoccus penangensis]|uniref:hypothetical protein n=1 Tax=Floricoccus penangensis TaxID=1859475 RepID=UPI002041DE62|nr:hypothetical protein [Floricoccus penangensis]URZ87218.1 hypothetical protein KIW23_09080 [Floricoccus penangensis]